ncbi:hypothetical protein COE30_20750 [Bacillus cereus]|nr:hypothetical protein COE30_20750 [Bacillus cereus]
MDLNKNDLAYFKISLYPKTKIFWGIYLLAYKDCAYVFKVYSFLLYHVISLNQSTYLFHLT